MPRTKTTRKEIPPAPVEQPSLLRLGPGEWRWPVAAALVVMALTCLPYFFGSFITPPGAQYTGLLYNTPDQAVYLSYMRQAHDGHLLFIDQFTTEPQQPWFFHILFLKLGTLSRITGLSLIAVFQVARVVCGAMLLVALYLFGAQFIQNIRARRFFLLFAAFASGFGWLYTLLFHPTGNQPHPPDFGPGVIMPEIVTFLSLLTSPLFCAALTLLVLVLLLTILALDRRSWKLALLAGVVGMGLANIHSYDMIPLAATIVLYLVARTIMFRRFVWQEWVLAAIIGAPSAIPLLYQVHIYSNLPVFRLKAEVKTLSPPVAHYLLAMGISFLLAIPGAVLALRRSRTAPVFILPVIWFVATLACSYLPFPFQRKMAEGMQIPLTLLAAVFVSSSLLDTNRLQVRYGILIAALLVIVSFPSNAFFLGKVSNDLQSINGESTRYLLPPLYLRDDQVETLDWLNQRHMRDNEAVLCNSMLGAYVPSWTGARTYIGHWSETLDYQGKLRIFAAFIRGTMPNDQRRDLLRSQHIRYIIVGPEERAYANGDVSLTGLPVREVKRIGDHVAIYVINH